MTSWIAVALLITSSGATKDECLGVAQARRMSDDMDYCHVLGSARYCICCCNYSVVDIRQGGQVMKGIFETIAMLLLCAWLVVAIQWCQKPKDGIHGALKTIWYGDNGGGG